MANNIKRKVPKSFQIGLESLISLVGFDKDNIEDLKLFAQMGGGAEKGISEVKINWVLKDGLAPREDFIYCLREIAIKVMGTDYYIKQGIENPQRYELERFLIMCEYMPHIGNVFPISEKFKRHQDHEVEKYVGAIPNIFWNLSIPFGEALSIFNAFVPSGGLEININKNIRLSLKRFSYEYVSGILQPIEIDGEDQRCEALGFKLTNTERKMSFKTIEAIRQINSSLIPITLINGNWIEMAGTLWCDYDYDLAIENCYNYLKLRELDCFFDTFEQKEGIESPNIWSINKLLMANPDYQEIYKRLTLNK